MNDVQCRTVLSKDPNLAAIIAAITNAVPVQSIILLGSRATGLAHKNSDYDVIAVMRTASAVRHYRRLKRVQHELTTALGVDVSVNPLTGLAMNRARGNLFLYKVKREGITIYGKDALTSLECGEPADIPMDRYFSFLFSTLRNLLEFAGPGIVDSPDAVLRGPAALAVAKGLLACGELHLLLRGAYEQGPEAMLLRLKSEVNGDTCLENLVNGIPEAIKVRKMGAGAAISSDAWFRCRGQVYSLFLDLMDRTTGLGIDDPLALGDVYVRQGGAGMAKNLEYFGLLWLGKRRFSWRGLLPWRRATRRARIALLLLALALEADGACRSAYIGQTRSLLGTFLRLPRPVGESSADWRVLHREIYEHWPYLETVMGFR